MRNYIAWCCIFCSIYLQYYADDTLWARIVALCGFLFFFLYEITDKLADILKELKRGK